MTPEAVTTTPNIGSDQLREMLRQVRRIEIRSRRAVQEILGGEYHSVFKGRGMEFDEVREYAPGDEIRDIDWNVTARTGRPFVKRYAEERERTVFFVVDVSGSSVFGAADRMKGEVAAEICSVLAFSAVQNNDRVGLLTFSDRVENLVPPRKGRKHVLRVVRELLFAQPQGRGTDLALAVDTLNKVLKRRAILFVVSDFFARDVRKVLMVANRKHDLIAVRLTDPREETLPPAGIVELTDAETGESFLIDAGSRRARERFAEAAELRRLDTEKLFRSLGVDFIAARTDAPYLDSLVRLFRRRARRY
jgi:uncharacterized protein (DUF58 family)